MSDREPVRFKTIIFSSVNPPEEEDSHVRSPNLLDQLRRKLDISHAHWLDYRRLFTTPN